MIKKAKISFLFFIAIFWFSSYSPPQNADKYKIQALYLYTFTNYISWETTANEFVIVTYKNSDIIPYLKQIQSSKKVQGKSIVITVIDPESSAGIPNCNIFYFDQKYQKEALNHLNNKNTQNILVVSQVSSPDKKWGNINLKEVDNSYKFEVYKSNIEKNKLKISSNLLKLAIKVYE